MRICPQCGFENEDIFHYCLQCGALLVHEEESGSKTNEETEEHREPEIKADEFISEAMQSDVPESNEESIDKAPFFPNTDGKVCPNCGVSLLSEDLFCPNCGAKYKIPEKKINQTTPQIFGETGTEIAGKLIKIKEDGTRGKEFPIYSNITLIGREKGDIIFENDQFLSPSHCKLFFENEHLVIQDMDSFNGVFLRIIDKSEIVNGDILRIGQELLLVETPSDFSDFSTDEKPLTSSTDTIYFIISQLISPTKYGKRFVINKPVCLIGRESGNIIFPEDGYVSRSHAEFHRHDDSCYVVDLGSSNGTFLKLHEKQELVNKDMVIIGQQLFLVELG